MSKKMSAEDLQTREETLRAFREGGSVMVDGKVITSREGLPEGHPARHFDKDENSDTPSETEIWEARVAQRDDRIKELQAQLDAAGDQDLMRARMVELQTHLDAANKSIEAQNATIRQSQLALDKANEERGAFEKQSAEYKAGWDRAAADLKTAIAEAERLKAELNKAGAKAPEPAQDASKK